MSRVLTMPRWVASAAVVLAALVMSSSASAASGPVWSDPAPYAAAGGSGDALFTSVDCRSVGNCVGVGLAANEEAFVAVESSGTWGQPSGLDAGALPDPSGSPSASVESVSCASATECTAVGSYQNASNDGEAFSVPISVLGTTATFDTAEATAVTPPAGAASDPDAILDGVSCPSASDCVAVGSYEAGSDEEPMVAVPGSTSPAVKVGLPVNADSSPQANLASISCPSAGASCEAVGAYDSGSDGQLMSAVVTADGGTASQVIPPGNFEPSSGDASGGPLSSGTGLDSVSCPSAGVCTAAGGYSTSSSGGPAEMAAVAVPILNGQAKPAQDLQSASSGSGSSLASISCTDAKDCSAVGYAVASLYPLALYGSEVNGSWLPLATFTTASSAIISAGTDVSCAQAERCSGVGIVESLSGGTPEAYPFTAASAPAMVLATVSLPGATVGKPYTTTLTASGGTGDYSWSISPGSLPAGLSLDKTTGVISGTPTAAGQSGFIANANDAGPPSQSLSRGLSITVSAAKPTPKVGVAYLTTSGKKATVVLTCANAECAGKLVITAKVKESKKTKTVTLVSKKYSVAAGKTKTLTLTLSSSAAKLLTKLHKISGDLKLTPTGAKKAAVIKKVTFKSAAK